VVYLCLDVVEGKAEINQKGPSGPAIMAVLGARRSLDRLEAGAAYVRRLTREAS
jgi:hypothetical protein